MRCDLVVVNERYLVHTPGWTPPKSLIPLWNYGVHEEVEAIELVTTPTGNYFNVLKKVDGKWTDYLFRLESFGLAIPCEVSKGLRMVTGADE